MRRAVILLLSATLGAGAAGACSSFGGLTPTDAGADGPAGADGASTDARPAALAEGGSPCDGGGHWVCDDFDRIADGGPEFPSWNQASDGGLSIAALEGAPSAPNVLTATASTPGAVAQLIALDVTKAKAVHCGLDVLVEKRAQNIEVVLVVLSIFNSNPGYNYRLDLRANLTGGKDQIERSGSAGGTENASVDLGTGKWHHVDFKLAVGSSVAIGADFDGEMKLDASLGLDAAAPPPTNRNFTIGAQPTGQGSDWIVRYDNVFCDLVQ